MNDAEKRLNKVVKFYQSLPKNVIDKTFENFGNTESINRTLRRDISKIKSSDKKIEFIMSSILTRKIFSEAAYVTIKDNIDLTLDNTNYEEIVDNITEENKLYYAIFFFRWCYERGNDGIDNDDKYFKRFVDSELFEHILNDKPINNNKNASITPETTAEIVNSDQSEDSKNLYNEVAKMKLLGRIERRGTWYNFFPQYVLVNGTFEEISSASLKTDFPARGGINLSHDFKDIPYTFLENIDVDSDSDLYAKNIYLVEFDIDDLEENDDPTYQKKIDLEKLIGNGHKLQNVIQRSNKIDVYKVVTSEATDFISDKIFLKGKDSLVENEKVVLLHDNRYFGPFKVYYRPLDQKYYINPNASANNYLIPSYAADAVEEPMEFEKQLRYENPHYTTYVKIIEESLTPYDVITDEILLEELKGNNISLELAVSDSKEFVQMCRKIPFFLNISESTSERRIKRLDDLISNSNKLIEKKQEILYKLLEQYPSVVEQKISSSTEIQNAIQEKDNRIRKLEQEKDNLKQEIDNLLADADANKNATTGVTNEQFEQYKNQNFELSEELNELKKVSGNITQLKEEQKKLENTNEYLRNQKAKLENESREAMNAVNNAIKSGIDKSAEVAFDPYISNVMLKEAAQWDSKLEDDYYTKRIEDLEALSESALSGKDLIEYIVNCVQTKRKYEYNDIINIYISVAQNFLTIFSGEPGTGKTSMCNIIADTLGLSNINRFVPVSVERGWSSKRDLIGYFNPLTRKYDKSNSKVYDALRTLDIERNNSKYPYIIMLDEANLSPIEYYWADFMRLTDIESDSSRSINIGTETEIFVPETLKFIATINTDQTTETLSPRLIDRACIIKLPEVSMTEDKVKSAPSAELITWNNFKNTFFKVSKLQDSTEKILAKIYKLFTSYGMNVSPRIQRIIEDYVKAAQEIMVDEVASKSETAIDYAVVQKLLPKINGYYSNYEGFFKSLREICTENNLKMTNKAIDKMIAAQERNMGYCQYLI